jgi:hypothetical protein
MTTTLMNYTYTGTNGDSYSGQVVADTTVAKCPSLNIAR